MPRESDRSISVTHDWQKSAINRLSKMSTKLGAIHLLGSKIKFDKEAGTLILRSLPTKLIDQLKRAS